MLARCGVRRRIGRWARRLADRWAPEPIRVEPDGKGWLVYANDVLIARVSPGFVKDRPHQPPAA